MTGTTEQAPFVEAQDEQREPLLVYVLLGTFLGILFVKSEVASWFRIQEMFHFRAIHMYGIIGSAIGVGAACVALMKRYGVRTVRGEEIHYPSKEEMKPAKRHILGGICFGLGWGLVGACPGPMFALVGTGLSVMFVAMAGALVGAWVYGLTRARLPH
jgi:uncharacterized membrane protein YedE/YeeE